MAHFDLPVPELRMSVAFMDPICPPSTVFAAFNNWRGSDTEIVEYPFNGHEGGGQLQLRRRLDWLAARWPGV